MLHAIRCKSLYVKLSMLNNWIGSKSTSLFVKGATCHLHTTNHNRSACSSSSTMIYSQCSLLRAYLSSNNNNLFITYQRDLYFSAITSVWAGTTLIPSWLLICRIDNIIHDVFGLSFSNRNHIFYKSDQRILSSFVRCLDNKQADTRKLFLYIIFTFLIFLSYICIYIHIHMCRYYFYFAIYPWSGQTQFSKINVCLRYRKSVLTMIYKSIFILTFDNDTTLICCFSCCFGCFGKSQHSFQFDSRLIAGFGFGLDFCLSNIMLNPTVIDR